MHASTCPRLGRATARFTHVRPCPPLAARGYRNRAPCSSTVYVYVCVCARAHYAYACWASCATKSASNRVESIAEPIRIEPSEADAALELKPAALGGRVSLRLAVLLICCLLCCAARNANNTKRKKNKQEIKNSL